MIADKILGYLTKVRPTGEGRWVACCPAHEDKSPSLAIREDGDRLLLKCFAGCDIEQIVDSVGLQVTDLFPESELPHRPLSRPFPAGDILKCLQPETYFLSLCALSVREGLPLTDSEMDHLLVASKTIRAAIKAGGFG